MPKLLTHTRTDSKGLIRSLGVKAISEGSTIDEETYTLKGVVMCQSRHVKGSDGWFWVWAEDDDPDAFENWDGTWFKQYPVHTPQEFIDRMVAIGQEKFQKQGQQVRFGHPDMCNRALGTYVGRAKNFRVEGISAIADIELDAIADKSPSHPKLREYVLGMSKDNSDALMMSIVYTPGPFYFEDEDGDKVILEDTKECKKKWLAMPAEKRVVYESITDWNYTDFVDNGANTDNMFRSFNGDVLDAGVVTQFLDQNPDLVKRLQKNPEVLTDYLSKYLGRNAGEKTQTKPKMEKKTFSQQLRAFSQSVSKAAQDFFGAKSIDATTTDGTGITIDTEADKPAVGDQVNITETGEPAPAGDHTIQGGDLDGTTITTDESGVITNIQEAAPDEPEGEESAGAETSEEIKSLSNRMSTLEKNVSNMLTGFQRLEKAIKDSPYAGVGSTGRGDSNNGQKKGEKQVLTPWEKQRQEIMAKKTANK